MKCPKCYGTDVSLVDTNQYVCNNPGCAGDENIRTQFTIQFDLEDIDAKETDPIKHLRFPYNQIFSNTGRNRFEFYRAQYLRLPSVGNTDT